MTDEANPAKAPEESPGAGPGAPQAKVKKVRFRRTRHLMSKVPHPPVGSKRFIALSVLTTAVIIGGLVGFTMWFIPYSESVAFCTTCHTMIPQHKAYEVSAHADVACGECHVEPTVQGWVKAKLAGTQELKALVLNNYPTPIPPIPHTEMPSTQVTCMKCHSLDRINTPGNPIKLILRPTYKEDEANTMDMVAVAIRPTGLGGSLGVASENGGASVNTVDTSGGPSAVLNPRGVHWHVATPVTVYPTDETEQEIPLVQYTNEQGQQESFISSDQIGLASDVTPDINRLSSQSPSYQMDCLDCHNMVGHNIPDPSAVLDQEMSSGGLDPTLPYIKRDVMKLVTDVYPTQDAANKAIDAFALSYAAQYPLVVRENPEALVSATATIKEVYDLTATPAMSTNAASYPDNLGHQRSPGCFRCHDGDHVKVVDGKATDEVIPSTCSTCHTFPQVGATVTGFQLGVPPESHQDQLYVFNHKNDVTSVDDVFSTNPTGRADCASCHQKSYCENCHDTGAVKVTHDEMLYNHKASIAKVGSAACAYCHQPVYCATCHADNVLGDTSGTGISQQRLD